MKNAYRFIITFIMISCFAEVYAQTADEIISKHINAIGGKEKINSITSILSENTIQVMGNEAPSTTTLLIGKGYRSESDFGGQKIIQVITDKGGWSVNPMMGSSDPQPMPEEQFKAAKDQLVFTPFIDYAANGIKVELAGKEKFGNGDAYKIIFTNGDNMTTTYYIDAGTFYNVKEVRKANVMGQDVEISVVYSDHKKSDFGVVLPYTMDIDYSQFQLTMKLNKVEFNKTVDMAIFEMKQ